MDEKGYKVGAMFSPKLHEEDDDDPLRLGDLMRFLIAVRRKTQCPHCEHRGQWAVALNDSSPHYNGENPPLTLFKNHLLHGSYHTAAGMTCPNCGHFAMISTYKIREFLAEEESKNG